MSHSRRSFLKQSLLTGAGLTIYNSTLARALYPQEDLVKLTILYTNDWHSRIEPWAKDDPKHPNMGGAARRATAIKTLRKKEKNILLLDAGDIFQGTPYFNFFGGELEYKIMSEMGYEATTIGNHDFDNGLNGLLKQMPHAKFDFLTANYDFSNTIIAGKTRPYKIFTKDHLKIGVFGLGVELNGLVPPMLCEGVQYLDPLEKAAEMAYLLKVEQKCDYIICLSHLGYSYPDKKVSDIVLAKESKNIDLIIGGHTHTYLEKPTIMRNREGKTVWITQMGWAGLYLGQIDLFFTRDKKQLLTSDASALKLVNDV